MDKASVKVSWGGSGFALGGEGTFGVEGALGVDEKSRDLMAEKDLLKMLEGVATGRSGVAEASVKDRLADCGTDCCVDCRSEDCTVTLSEIGSLSLLDCSTSTVSFAAFSILWRSARADSVLFTKTGCAGGDSVTPTSSLSNSEASC